MNTSPPASVPGADPLAAALLAKRAEALANRPLASAQPAAAVSAWLVARLGGERVACLLVETAAVMPAGRLAAIPGAGLPLLGITSRRGVILAIADLAHLLGLGAGVATASAMIVVPCAGAGIGLLVDAVEGIRRWRGDELAAARSSPLTKPPFSGRSGDGVSFFSVSDLLRLRSLATG